MSIVGFPEGTRNTMPYLLPFKKGSFVVAIELGAHGECVEKPNEIRPALERAYASGKPALVNVMTSDQARAQTVRFSAYTT